MPWVSTALAIGTSGDDFGCPASIRTLDLATPNSTGCPKKVEFHHPEPRGSTSDVGFGRGDVGWRFWLPHIHQDREFGHPEALWVNVGRWLWPWGRRRCVQALDLVTPRPLGCHRALGLATLDAVGQHWMLALAMGTSALCSGRGFGCPTSLRTTGFVAAGQPWAMGSAIEMSVLALAVGFGHPKSHGVPSDVEFHHPECCGSTLDVGFGCGDVG